MNTDIPRIVKALTDISINTEHYFTLSKHRIHRGDTIARVNASIKGGEAEVSFKLAGYFSSSKIDQLSAHEKMELKNLQRTITADGAAVLEELCKEPLLRHANILLSIDVKRSGKRRRPLVFTYEGHRLGSNTLIPRTIGDRLKESLQSMALIPPQFMEGPSTEFTINDDVTVYAPTAEAAVYKAKILNGDLVQIKSVRQALNAEDIVASLDAAEKSYWAELESA